MEGYKTKYDVTPHVIYSLLTGNHTFRIPNFQREYVWATKEKETASDRQVNEFFNDIYEASGQGENYYIGSIITYEGNEFEHFLVDGQQRLTTLMILFAAFRDYQLEIIGKEEYKVSDPYLRFNQQIPGNQRQVDKLVISNRSGKEFLKELLIGYAIEDIDVRVGSKAMREAYDFCLEFYKSKGQTASKKFIDYILKHVELSWIQADDMESAFIVFERMNDRGKDLVVSDKFKYLIFQQDRDEDLEAQSSEINDSWNQMKKDLSSAENTDKPKFDRFLSYFMVSRFLEEKWLGTSQLYSWVRQPKNIDLVGLNKPKTFLKKMENDLDLHCKFLNGLNKDSSENKNLKTIKSYASDVRQHIPILLASHIGSVSENEFNKLTEALEKLVFALKISGAQWNVVNTLVPKWCTALRNKDLTINKFISEAIQPEINKRAEAMSLNLTNTENLNTSLIKYVLEKTNEIICLEAGEPVSTTMKLGKKNSHTIEHVLPVNYSNEHVHPKSDYVSTKSLIWRLGNLTLLERVTNSKLGDKSPFEKFEMGGYKDSNIILSKIIRVKKFSGEPGPKHKAVIKKYHIEPIELEENQFWTEKQIAKREKIYFSVLSEFFGVELKSVSQ